MIACPPSHNDSMSFFTQCFSGGRLTQIRAKRENERVVPNININILMGTQPSRLLNVFTKDALASGFTSRFLMVESDYMKLNTEVDPFSKNKEMSQDWTNIVQYLYQLKRSPGTRPGDLRGRGHHRTWPAWGGHADRRWQIPYIPLNEEQVSCCYITPNLS